jgi:hypothetical protein
MFPLLAMPIVVPGLACGDNDDSAVENSNADRVAVVNERAQFEREADRRLDDIDQRIQELQDRRAIEQQGGNASDDLDDELNALKARRDKLATKLDRMRDMGNQDWDRARDDVDDELSKIINQLNGM